MATKTIKTKKKLKNTEGSEEPAKKKKKLKKAVASATAPTEGAFDEPVKKAKKKLKKRTTGSPAVVTSEELATEVKERTLEEPAKKNTKKIRKDDDAPAHTALSGDRWATCKHCEQEFCTTAQEVTFFQEKGFEIPTRCKDCRWEKKQRNMAAKGKGDKGKGKGKDDKGKGKGKGKGGKGDKGKGKGGGGICYKFKEGNCAFGTSCKFSHD
eukprot:TRINITY_DN5114_c0_g1_i4.p1 TRINITY_DN5114_c0_g1~~TRINITY_DN5114_c0_g1_i4.p1  ORF type:complete len:211 (+),score=67.52 TRINITY_DN5114_c0_g1_i4:160-792(+)